MHGIDQNQHGNYLVAELCGVERGLRLKASDLPATQQSHDHEHRH
jgi:hypothetical protein